MYLVRRDNAFGDVLMAGMAVATLNDHGVKTALITTNHAAASLVYVPKMTENPDNWQEVWFEYESFRHDTSTSYIQGWLNKFSQVWLGGSPIKLTRRSVPVYFTPIPDTPVYDVAIGSLTGNWTLYKSWPHYDRLKQLLDRNGLTWIDLDKSGVFNNECLNIVRKCGVYLGLDTGRSHYVSSEAAGKTLILHSGFSGFNQWCVYDYEVIEKKVECSPCYLNVMMPPCPNGFKCFNDIRPEFVVERIIEKLSRSPFYQPSQSARSKLYNLPVV